MGVEAPVGYLPSLFPLLFCIHGDPTGRTWVSGRPQRRSPIRLQGRGCYGPPWTEIAKLPGPV
jgi:hypothetical protein